MKGGSFVVVCILAACMGFTTVHSASFYIRAGKEAQEDPIVSEIIDEVVSELRKEPLEILADVPVVKNLAEAIPVPSPAVVNIVEPIPVALISDNVVSAAEPSVKNAAPQDAIAQTIVNVKGAEPTKPEEKKPLIAEIEKESEIKEQPAADSKPETDEKKDTQTDEAPIEMNSVKSAISADELKESVRQSDGSTSRPTILQQAQNTITNILNNNPIANAINSIRQPSTPAPNEEIVEDTEVPIIQQEADQPSSSTSRPGFIQQFQTSVQSIQNQIQSVFNPNAASGASASNAANANPPPVSEEPSTSRPTILQQIQTAVGQPIQGLVSGIQNNLQNAQNQISGIFRPQSAANGAANSNDPNAAASGPASSAIPNDVDPASASSSASNVPASGSRPSASAAGSRPNASATGSRPNGSATPSRPNSASQPTSEEEIPIVNQGIETVDPKIEIPSIPLMVTL